MKKLFAVTLTLALMLSLTAAMGEEKTVIRYSKSQGPYTELFEDGIVPILEKQGYTLEVVEASDLLVADKMLEAGDVDVNVEQHTAYIHIACFQHFVGYQQIAGFHDLQGVALLFQDRNYAVLKQLRVGALGLGIADHGFFFGQNSTCYSQKKCKGQQNRNHLFHGFSPLFFHVFCVYVSSPVRTGEGNRYRCCRSFPLTRLPSSWSN